MTKRSKAPARALAVIALIAAFAVVVAVVASALGGDDSGTDVPARRGGKVTRQPSTPKKAPKVYVIKNGDTLTAIAHETGVPIATIQRLNPEVDPQILISGEKLKLR
jgi:LysM repeat protein